MTKVPKQMEILNFARLIVSFKEYILLSRTKTHLIPNYGHQTAPQYHFYPLTQRVPQLSVHSPSEFHSCLSTHPASSTALSPLTERVPQLPIHSPSEFHSFLLAVRPSPPFTSPSDKKETVSANTTFTSCGIAE